MKLAIKDVGYNRLVFGEILRFGFGAALGLFTAVELTLALLSLRLFRSEVPACAKPTVVCGSPGRAFRNTMQNPRCSGQGKPVTPLHGANFLLDSVPQYGC